MRLMSKGTELSYKSLVIKESFSQYYTEVVAVMPFPIAGELDLEIGSKRVSLVVFEMKKEENSLTYTLIPRKVFDLLSSTFNAFKGIKTLEKLASIYGMNVNTVYKTMPVFWDLPQCKFKSLIDLIKDRTVIPNGGGAVMTINLFGDLVVSDMKGSQASKALRIAGNIKTEKISYDWRVNQTGVVNLITDSGEGTKQQVIVMERGYGESTVRRLLTVDSHRETLINVIRNRFYRLLYTSRVLNIENVLCVDIEIGRMVEEISYGLKMFVFSTTISRVGNKVTVEATIVTK